MQDQQKNLAANVRQLREARGLSQQRMAEMSGIPRPTWASLESGTANPTLAVLARASAALNVSIEELVGPPRSDVRLVRAADVRQRRRQGATLRSLVPESIAGLEISRMEFEPGGRMVGVPHKPGNREYLTCEQGRIELVAEGRHFLLDAGDMLVFRGDQRHSYINRSDDGASVAVSVVCFAG